MLTGNYRSMDFIIERLYRNSIIARKANVSEYDLAEYIGEAMLLIGAKPQFQDNFALINIVDYRGKLPCSPTAIEAVRDVQTGMGARTSTDTFAGSPNNNEAKHVFIDMHDYTIKGNVIHMTALKKGDIEIKFQSLMTDDNGYPMIPDDERYAKAIESYIKWIIYRPLWEIGEIRDRVYDSAEQDWLFYVNSAKTKALQPSVDQMESLKNQVVKLLKDFNTRTNTGRDLGRQEQRRGYNVR